MKRLSPMARKMAPPRNWQKMTTPLPMEISFWGSTAIMLMRAFREFSWHLRELELRENTTIGIAAPAPEPKIIW